MTYGHAWLLAQRCSADESCTLIPVCKSDDGSLVCITHAEEEMTNAQYV